MSIDIAAVVNLHCEGPSATPSLVSAWRAAEAARQNGQSVQLVLALDRADQSTVALANEWADRGARLVECDEGDLGAARNAAANAVDTEWIAFLDGDDLWSENWLVSASEVAAQRHTTGADLFVLHPAVNVIFGDNHSLLHHRSSDDPSFSWTRFRLHNAWTALSYVRRDNLLQLPYPRNDLEQGNGFEDWSWNMAVLDRGGSHQVVADTCHFIRRSKGGSLLGASQRALRTPYPLDDESIVLTSRPPVVELSELTAIDPTLPPTHSLEDHALSEVLLEQIRLAETIEPAIADTLTSSGHPRQIAQNFNTHVTAEQRALESVELILANNAPNTVADALADSAELTELAPGEQHRVVAEVLRSVSSRTLPRGSSLLIDATLQTFPQLDRGIAPQG